MAAGALSPDGQKLAYELSRAGDDRTELWVMHLDGGQRELLATDAKWPVWSRDGTTVAYSKVRLNSRPLEAATAYQRLGGTEQFLLPWNQQQYFGPADWTPDGSGLIGTFMSSFATGGPTSIVLWSVSNPRALSPERTLMSAPDGTQLWAQNRSYSPNGRWIAFTLLNLQANRVEPYVAPASGAPLADWVRIAPGHESPDKPRWSADGEAILFISREATSYRNLWATRFDPGKGRPIGKPFALTSFDSAATVISPYFDVSELSVSRRHVAMTMLTVSGNLWMLEGVDR